MQNPGVYVWGIGQNAVGFCKDMRTSNPVEYRTRAGCAIREAGAALFEGLSFPADAPVAVWRACNYGSFFLFADFVLAERDENGHYSIPEERVQRP